MKLKPISKEEIEEIVSRNVNAIYREIQQKIGVETGDIAGLYHSGSEIEDQMVYFFQQYFWFEKDNNEDREDFKITPFTLEIPE